MGPSEILTLNMEPLLVQSNLTDISMGLYQWGLLFGAVQSTENAQTHSWWCVCFCVCVCVCVCDRLWVCGVCVGCWMCVFVCDVCLCVLFVFVFLCCCVGVCFFGLFVFGGGGVKD